MTTAATTDDADVPPGRRSPEPSAGTPAGATPVLDRFRRLAESAPVGIIEADVRDGITYVNERWRQITGVHDPLPLGYEVLRRLVHPDDHDRVRAGFERIFTERAELDLTARLCRDGGSIAHVRLQAGPMLEDGRLLGFVGTVMDLTQLVETTLALERSEQALRQSEARYRRLILDAPVPQLVSEIDGTLIEYNHAFRSLMRSTPAEIEGRAPHRLIHPDDLELVASQVEQLLAGETDYFEIERRLVRPDGSLVWVTGGTSLLRDGDRAYLHSVMQDISPLMSAKEEMARLAGIVESTSDLVGIVDWASDRFLYLNRAARELFGLVEADLAEHTYHDIFAEAAARIVVGEVIPVLEEGGVWSGELPMVAADGTTVLVWQTIAAELDDDGAIRQLSAVGRDVTDRRRAEEQLSWMATHDPLTGLPNRALLLDHLELGLARAERDGRLVALLFLDLDRFKQINDTLGHEAGDELLTEAARRLTSVLRPADTVARLGGDEFVLLAEDVHDEREVMDIGDRVADVIAARPFTVAGQEVPVTASIGIALSSGGTAHPEALLRDADAAMYRAKDQGRSRIELFDDQMRLRAARRTELAQQLAVGLEDDHIAVHFQPCVNLDTGRVTGVEALARWAHPDRGVLSPYEFISLAEETGLIVGLGLIVLSKACHQAHQWEELLGPDAPTVHVNLSARQLGSTTLPTLVEGVLAGSGLTPSKLCLEITESVLMDDAPTIIDTLWALKAIGVSLAIDDFGTGYSSLSYLRRFPVDVLKVDQSFVDGLGPDPEDSAIVAAIINLATSLELDAVAEGVETREQLERLRALGCTAAQGYWFSEPRPAPDIEPLLRAGFPV